MNVAVWQVLTNATEERKVLQHGAKFLYSNQTHFGKRTNKKTSEVGFKSRDKNLLTVNQHDPPEMKP